MLFCVHLSHSCPCSPPGCLTLPPVISLFQGLTVAGEGYYSHRLSPSLEKSGRS